MVRHHLDGNSNNHSRSNIVLAHRGCHTAEENKLRALKAKQNARIVEALRNAQSAGASRGVSKDSKAQKSRRSPNVAKNGHATDSQSPKMSGRRVTERERERERERNGHLGGVPVWGLPAISLDISGAATGGQAVQLQATGHPAFGSAEMAANYIMEHLWRSWVYRHVLAHGYISKDDAVEAGAEILQQELGRGSAQSTTRYLKKAGSRVGHLVETRQVKPYPVWVARDESAKARMQAEIAVFESVVASKSNGHGASGLNGLAMSAKNSNGKGNGQASL